MKPYKVTLRNQQDKALALRAVERCPWGYTVWFKPPVRTLAQNDRMWPFLEDIAAQKDWPLGSGIKRTENFWKDLFTAALTTQEIVPGLEGGFVAVGKHTSEFDVTEMSDMLTLLEAWGVQNGVEFTDKKKNSLGTATEGSREPENTGAGGSGSRTNSRRAQ
jgi:hypothetical protein